MHTVFASLAVVAALATSSVSLCAQQMQFSGKVENGEGVCYYCPGYDYVIDNSHTSLSSDSIDLLPYVGLYVRGLGQWNGSVTAPAIEVLALEVVEQDFSIGGNSSPGGKMSFSVEGTPGDVALIVLAFNDGFFPAGAAADAAFLAPQSLFILGQGAVGGGGSFTIKVDLPDNPALIGLNVFGQGALRHADGSLTLTTSDRKVID